jgi:hypothetical protein
MSDMAFVLRRLESGDRIRFVQGYYGQQWIELSRGWLLRRKTRITLPPDQIMQIKRALEQRGQASRKGN